jgi:hypothetical protein
VNRNVHRERGWQEAWEGLPQPPNGDRMMDCICGWGGGGGRKRSLVKRRKFWGHCNSTIHQEGSAQSQSMSAPLGVEMENHWLEFGILCNDLSKQGRGCHC